jgi:hypothetical protein
MRWRRCRTRPPGPARRGDDDAPAAADFVADVVAFAEPVESTCAGLEPNLVRVEFDDDAMAEAMREMAEPYDDDRPRDTKLRQRHASGHDVDTKLGFGHELRLPTEMNSVGIHRTCHRCIPV